MKINSVNKVIVLGTISTHQWGMVASGGGNSPAVLASSHKYPQIVVKKWQGSVSNKQQKKGS